MMLPKSKYESDLNLAKETGDWAYLFKHADADHFCTQEDIDRELLHINPLRYIWDHPSNVKWASVGTGIVGAASYKLKSFRPLFWLNVCAFGFRLGQYKYPR